MTENSKILVSICCITYNHVQFIRKALDGFLMQEPPTGVSEDEPWFEILIHDDCSTDGTDEIIKEYAAKYPDRIFPLYETENQYSKVGTSGIDFFNYNRARGRYIAYCEGDDYWTDAKKLQKQVDFMESHTEYSICFHRVKHYFASSGDYKEDKCGQILADNEGVDITPALFFKAWYTQPLSMLFRVSMFDYSLPKKYNHYRDSHEIYHLLKKGKGYLFAFFGGVYNRHKGGIHSEISNEQEFTEALMVADELYMQNQDSETKDYLISILQWIVDWDKSLNRWLGLKYISRILWLSGDRAKYIRNMKKLIFTKRQNA